MVKVSIAHIAFLSLVASKTCTDFWNECKTDLQNSQLENIAAGEQLDSCKEKNDKCNKEKDQLLNKPVIPKGAEDCLKRNRDTLGALQGALANYPVINKSIVDIEECIRNLK